MTIDADAPEIRIAPSGARYLSSSQMSKIDEHVDERGHSGCDRAWGFRYRDGIKTAPKPSAAFGTALHAILEAYSKTGVLPESRARFDVSGKEIPSPEIVALSGLRFLPVPPSGAEIEHEFDLEAWPGVYFTGKIDIYDRRRCQSFEIGEHSDESTPRAWPRWHEMPIGRDAAGELEIDAWPIPLVLDHKNTYDFGKYVKTPAQLRSDPQTAFYGLKAVRDFEADYGFEPPEVQFRWVYYLRAVGHHNARAVDLLMTTAEIKSAVDRWRNAADRAISYHKIGAKAEDMPKRLTGCMAYGGCEYGPITRAGPKNLNICRRDPTDRMAVLMSGLKLSQAVQNFMKKPGDVAPAATGDDPFADVSVGAIPKTDDADPFADVGADAPAATGADDADPFADVTAPEAAKAVDPRIAEIPAKVGADRAEAWLAHCDAKGLDHKTGLPRAGQPAKVITPAVAAAPKPAAVVAPPKPSVPQKDARGIARALYDAGDTPPEKNADSDVVRMYNAIVALEGPPPNAKAPEVKRGPGRPPKSEISPNRASLIAAGEFLIALAKSLPE